jgi:general stress protein YciG
MQTHTELEDEEPTANAEEHSPEAEATPPRKHRGFAGMDRAAIVAISRKGGLSAHAHGTAHRFTKEEAREAGRKGGRAPHRTRGRQPRATLEPNPIGIAR